MQQIVKKSPEELEQIYNEINPDDTVRSYPDDTVRSLIPMTDLSIENKTTPLDSPHKDFILHTSYGDFVVKASHISVEERNNQPVLNFVDWNHQIGLTVNSWRYVHPAISNIKLDHLEPEEKADPKGRKIDYMQLPPHEARDKVQNEGYEYTKETWKGLVAIEKYEKGGELDLDLSQIIPILNQLPGVDLQKFTGTSEELKNALRDKHAEDTVILIDENDQPVSPQLQDLEEMAIKWKTEGYPAGITPELIDDMRKELNEKVDDTTGE